MKRFAKQYGYFFVSVSVLASAFASASEAPSNSITVASATTTAGGSASAEANVQGSSTAPLEQKSTARSPIDSVYFAYSGTYHGASLKDFGSAQTVNRFGVQQKQSSNFTNVNFDSEVNLGWTISKDYAVGALVPFIYVPVNGQAFVMGDAGVKFTAKHLINGGGFNLYENIMLQAPTSDSSKMRDMKYGVKSTPAISYRIPHSNFTLGSWNEMKYYAGVNTDKTFKLWTLPYIKYNLTEKFALNVQYEMEWHHNVGEAGFFTFSTYMTDLQPGFIYNITPKISVNPYVQLFTMDQGKNDGMALGAYVSAAIL